MEEALHNRFSTLSDCSASGASAPQPRFGGARHMAASCWELGWPGEVREAVGKGRRGAIQAQKPSLTLFPAAASAISIYSPAASPPGHSAAAVAGFQGCSVIKHPFLLQLPHFASPGGLSSVLEQARRGCRRPAPDTVAALEGRSPAMVGELPGAWDGPRPLLPLPACCPSPLGAGGVPALLLYRWRKEQALQPQPDLGLCPGVSSHRKDPRPPPATGPDPSTWHPVPWTGSLWASSPLESRHMPAVAVPGHARMRG